MKTISEIFLSTHLVSIKKLILPFLIFMTLLLNSCIDDKSVELKEGSEKKDNGFMVVYPNSGNLLTIVDCNSFEIVKTIYVDIQKELQIHRMCLSTNKDYFIFCASSGPPHFSNYIISYNIEKDSIDNIIPTGLDSVGAPRLTAAYIPEHPGLIYLYSHNVGLFSIDFFTKAVEMISYEHAQSLGKHFYISYDQKLIAILKQFGSGTAFSEIELYKTSSGLKNIQTVLNYNNEDWIQIDDIDLTKDNRNIFVSIRLSQMRGIANYFGSYDLETKELYKSTLTFPWSLNPYYIKYNSGRGEVYVVGAQDKFYVIDVSSKDYLLKTVIDLPGKIPSPSRILIRPDEKVAFVSCVYSNFVIAIDLDKKSVLKKIPIEAPYLMLLM